MTGGIETALLKMKPPETAIIAVGVDELSKIAKLLINAGTKRILLEKPGGISLYDIMALDNFNRLKKSNIWIAYNRRFYFSVLLAEKMIFEDGGITSLYFEFTEWSHQIKLLQKSNEVFEHWVLANHMF